MAKARSCASTSSEDPALDGINVQDDNEVSYYHFDGLGSVIALSDPNGDTVQTYEYSVYGEVAASDPNHPATGCFAETSPNAYLFAGIIMGKFRKEGTIKWRQVFTVPCAIMAACVLALVLLFRPAWGSGQPQFHYVGSRTP